MNRIADDVIIDISGGRYLDSHFISGKDCLIASGAYLNVCREIILQNHVAISPRAMIFTHSYWQNVLDGYSANFGSVSIGNDSWLGASAQVLPNTIIGKGAIVMSGSVVTKEVKDYTLVGGIPAKELKNNLKKDITDANIHKELSVIINEFLIYLSSMSFKITRIKPDSYEILCPNGEKRQLEYIFNGNNDNTVFNDIIIIYKNCDSINARSILCIMDQSINHQPDSTEFIILEYFRRRGIRFYFNDN